MSRRKNRDYRDYVADIHGIRSFVCGMNYEEFLSAFKTSYAVMKALENMGAAAKKVAGLLPTLEIKRNEHFCSGNLTMHN